MKKGDPSAEMYINYVRANHAGLRAFIRSLGVDALWVDDIAQEAFIVAYQRMEEFDEERDFGAWVRGIARNLVINERRKNARRKRIIFDNLTDVLVLSSSASEDEQGEAEAAFGMGVGSGDQTRAKMLVLRECLQMIPKKKSGDDQSSLRRERLGAGHRRATRYEICGGAKKSGANSCRAAEMH